MKRNRLPDERTGLTHRVVIETTKVYIRTGEYPDGSLGEIFITIDKEGSDLRVYDIVAISMSIGLQHGIPLAEYIDKFKLQKMEPRGVTNNPEIPVCSSLADYLARWLELKYLEDENEEIDIGNNTNIVC